MKKKKLLTILLALSMILSVTCPESVLLSQAAENDIYVEDSEEEKDGESVPIDSEENKSEEEEGSEEGKEEQGTVPGEEEKEELGVVPGQEGKETKEVVDINEHQEETKQATISLKIDGTVYAAENLQEAIAESGKDVSEIKSIEFISGTITQADLDYVSQLTYLESFTMNLNENLVLCKADGTKTTILGDEGAILKFAPKPTGSSKGKIKDVVLGGITEIQDKGLEGDSIKSINMPNVVTVGNASFSGFKWLEKISLPNAVEIGESAFYNCTRLTSLEMEKVEILKKGSFKYTNSLKKLTLPGTIKTIEDIEFGSVTQGNKNGTKITIQATTPPTVARGAFDGVASSGTTYSTITVPHGALAAYVQQNNSSADVTGVLRNKEVQWNHLYLAEEGTYKIIYDVPQKSWLRQFAFVEQNTAIAEGQIPEVSSKDGKGEEGYVLSGWNTKKDGSGTALKAGDIIKSDMTVYPQWEEEKQDVITVKVNDVECGGQSLEEALNENAIDEDDVKKLEFVSGKITKEDLDFIKENMKYSLEILKMNLNENLQYTGTETSATTVLPYGAFQKMTGLVEVEIGGFTEISGSAFRECTSLEKILMPNVEEIGVEAFYWTDELEEITLPSCLQSLNNCGFGRAKNGSKTLHVIMEGGNPPEVKGSPFKSADTDSFVTIPQESIANYLPSTDLSKYITDETMTEWATLRVDDPGYHFIQFKGEKVSDRSYAFVKAGERIAEDRIRELSKDGYQFDGYYTQENGQGEVITADTIPTADMVVYANWKELVTITFNVEGQEIPVTVVKGEKIGEKLPEDPTLDGYKFAGWNTEKDGAGTVVTEDTIAESDMIVYAIFEEEIVLPQIESVTAENGTATIVLSQRPTNAPVAEDIGLSMNLNNSGNKEIAITGFQYDGNQTIMITFESVAQTAQEQSFTVTVTMNGMSVTSNQVIVPAKEDNGNQGTDPTNPGAGDQTGNAGKTTQQNNGTAVKTGDMATSIYLLLGISVAALCTIVSVLLVKKRRMK